MTAKKTTSGGGNKSKSTEIFEKETGELLIQDNVEAFPDDDKERMYHYKRGNEGTSVSVVFDTGIDSYTLPYSHLRGATFNLKNGIIIDHSHKNLLIEGRNLRPVYEYLSRFKLSYIRVHKKSELEENFATFIDTITEIK